MLRGTDTTALKAKITGNADTKLVYGQLVKRLHEIAAEDRASDELVSKGWCHSQYVTPGVLQAGFVACLDKDPIAVEHVERQVAKLALYYSKPSSSAYFSNAHLCLAVDMCRDQISSDVYGRFLELAKDHLIPDTGNPEYFFTHFNSANNTVTTHVISAAVCALLFGLDSGYAEAETVVQYGIDACEQHLIYGYDEKGVPHEGPMYSLVSIEWVFLYADLIRRYRGIDLFAEFPKFAVIAQAFNDIQLPGDIGIIGFDDCRDLIEQIPMSWLLLTTKEYDRPQDYRLWKKTRDDVAKWQERSQQSKTCRNHLLNGWRAVLDLLWYDDGFEKLRDSDTPACSFVSRGKAFAMFRSSRQSDAVAVNILGQGRSHNVLMHTHADAGHFSIYAYNELLAYDTAYFNFFEDTHSVVLIDDQPVVTECPGAVGNLCSGRFTRHEATDLLDYLCVDAASPKHCIWALRHFLFVRIDASSSYLVILDNINKDNAVHNYKWQLQANMHCCIEKRADFSARITGRNAYLDCHFFNPEKEDFPGSPHRLSVYHDQHQHLDPMTREPETNPRLVAEQEGCNCTLASVIIPGSTCEDQTFMVSSKPSYRTFDIYVESNRYRDRIIYACDHSYIRLPDLKTTAEIMVIRYDRNDNTEVARWSIL